LTNGVISGRIRIINSSLTLFGGQNGVLFPMVLRCMVHERSCGLLNS